MHVIFANPKQMLPIIETMMIEQAATQNQMEMPESLVDAFSVKYAELFLRSGVYNYPNDVDLLVTAYRFGSLGCKEYIHDVFFGNVFFPFLHKDVVAWFDEFKNEPEDFFIGEATQYAGFLRSYSETHPVKSFGECEDYHHFNLQKIHQRNLKAHQAIKTLKDRVHKFVQGKADADYIDNLIKQMDSKQE